jgi:hypothetical protein
VASLRVEGAVHVLDLAIGPGIIGFGEAVLDGVFLTHTPKDRQESIGIPLAVGELNAVVRQNLLDLIRHGSDEVTRALCGHSFHGLRVRVGIGALRCPVNGDKQVEFTFFGTPFGDVEVEVADRVGLKTFSFAAYWLPCPASFAGLS